MRPDVEVIITLGSGAIALAMFVVIMWASWQDMKDAKELRRRSMEAYREA